MTDVFFKDGMAVQETANNKWLVTRRDGGVTEQWGPYEMRLARSLVTRDDWDKRVPRRLSGLARQLAESEELLVMLDRRVAQIASARDVARQELDDVIERAKVQFVALQHAGVLVATARAAAEVYRDKYVSLIELVGAPEEENHHHPLPWE